MFLVGTSAMLCNGCGNTWFSQARYASRLYFEKGQRLKLTRADVARIPYASMAARLGDGPQALLILARYEGDALQWVSQRREVIVTRRGRVVKTYGLPQDLTGTQFLSRDPVGRPDAVLALTAATATECLRTLDLEPHHIDGMLVRSRFSSAGIAPLEILGATRTTHRWIETGAAPRLDWEFRNEYWIDPGSGYVWKSRQHVAPALPPLELVIYRPARPATISEPAKT